jgi:hypothetical protein
MAKYTFQAVVNYPETEADTPIYQGCDAETCRPLTPHHAR